MNPGIVLAAAAGAYLLGSISFARIVGRRMAPGEDLTSTDMELVGGAHLEYGGVSATSIGARSGPRAGMTVGVLDMAKAFVPVLVLRLAYPDDSYHLVAAVAAVAGHDYPLWHGFRGGRGMSPILGGLLAIDWLAVPGTTVGGAVIGLFVFRDMAIAYTAFVPLLVPWFAWRGGWPEVWYAVAVTLLFVVASIPELRAYTAKAHAGEITQIRSWRDLRRSHPGLGPGRFDDGPAAGPED